MLRARRRAPEGEKKAAERRPSVFGCVGQPHPVAAPRDGSAPQGEGAGTEQIPTVVFSQTPSALCRGSPAAPLIPFCLYYNLSYSPWAQAIEFQQGPHRETSSWCCMSSVLPSPILLPHPKRSPLSRVGLANALSIPPAPFPEPPWLCSTQAGAAVGLLKSVITKKERKWLKGSAGIKNALATQEII